MEDFKQQLENLKAENQDLAKNFNEMRLFHRDIVNEMKNQGVVLVELKDYVKQLAEFKHESDTQLTMLNRGLEDHKNQESDTFKRIFTTMENKEKQLEKRIESLESDRKWVIRIIVGAVIMSLLYLLGLKGG